MGQRRVEREWPAPRNTRFVYVIGEDRLTPPVQGLVVAWTRHSHRWSALVCRVADVFCEVITDRTQRTTPGVSHGFVPHPLWLFPGRPATQPANAESLRRRLGNLGITSVRSARNTALITLAREVPPVVLGDLLGLSVGPRCAGATSAAAPGLPTPPIVRVSSESLPLPNLRTCVRNGLL